jgi:preprotein translocase subunit Sec61beta
MASKWKAVTQVARILLGIAAGYLVYWQWYTIRRGDPETHALAAGLIVAIMVIVLLKKINKGEG